VAGSHAACDSATRCNVSLERGTTDAAAVDTPTVPPKMPQTRPKPANAVIFSRATNVALRRSRQMARGPEPVWPPVGLLLPGRWPAASSEAVLTPAETAERLAPSLSVSILITGTTAGGRNGFMQQDARAVHGAGSRLAVRRLSRAAISGLRRCDGGEGGQHSATSQTHAAGGAPFTTQVRGSKRRRPGCTLYEPAAARICRLDRAAIRSTAPSRSASATATSPAACRPA
jgi:hypothetical protein